MTNPHATPCPGSALSLTGPLDGWGGISQEQEITYQVNNRSPHDCSMEGYPTIRFYGPGASTFTYRSGHSQGPFLSTKPPSRVVVAAHGWAYFQIVRTTCEGMESTKMPRTLRITMPGGIRVFVERLKPGQGFPICTAGSTDYGSIVSTSPIRLNGHGIIGF